MVHPEHPSMAAEDFLHTYTKSKVLSFGWEPVLKAIQHFIMQGLPLMKKILESGITMMAALAAEYLQPKE